MGALEETIVEVAEIAPPPQDSNVVSLVSPLGILAQAVNENLPSADASMDSDDYSEFMLFGECIFTCVNALMFLC